MTSTIDRFRKLHESGCFVIPNPWDIGSARILARLGFQAIATTSAGFAWSIGRRDNHIKLEDALTHLRAICSAVDIPVNADFEGGFAVDPEGVAKNVAAATSTEVAGLSIEDSSGEANNPLFDFKLAIERIRAAREAIDRTKTRVLLVGRSEGFISGRPDLNETIRRLVAYSEAGAECLYAPGLKTMSDIKAVVEAVKPKPVNVVVGTNFTTVEELASAGVRRISIGGSLARMAWAGFLTAAKEIAEKGTFSAFQYAVNSKEMNGYFE